MWMDRCAIASGIGENKTRDKNKWVLHSLFNFIACESGLLKPMKQ